MEIRYTGNETVDKLYGVEITGSVIPSIWYSKILNESGKPDTVAINLLADIVYWYRPTEEHNEFDPDVITLKKKFSVDKLQLGYEQIRKKYGFTKYQSRRALETLERLDLIEREYRTVTTKGSKLGNVMFIGLNADKVIEITYPDRGPHPCHNKPTRVSEKSNEVIEKNQAGSNKKPTTNTKILTKNTTENHTHIYQSAVDGVREQLEYDALITDKRYDRGMIDGMIELMAEIMTSRKRNQMVNGELKPTKHVADRLKKIDADMLKYVIDSIKVSPNPVSNTRSYMLTALYNAPVTYQTHLDMTVRHDMHAREFGSWDNSFPAV